MLSCESSSTIADVRASVVCAAAYSFVNSPIRLLTNFRLVGSSMAVHVSPARALERVVASPSAIQATHPKTPAQRMRWTPTKPTGKTYSLDNATTMPEVCRPRLREDIDFSTTGLSPDEDSMHFYLHEREKLCKDRQTVVTALRPCRRWTR